VKLTKHLPSESTLYANLVLTFIVICTNSRKSETTLTI